MITQTGYASYFLIVSDFYKFARSNGVMVGPGRGSAAGRSGFRQLEHAGATQHPG